MEKDDKAATDGSGHGSEKAGTAYCPSEKQDYQPMFGPGGWAENLSRKAIAVEIEARQKDGRDPTGVTVICADAIRPQPVEWLWPGWLARGKVHLLAGAPGTGKTSAALAFAATVTVGGRWPDGTKADVGHVLVWSGEDDPADTLVPRLLACDAELSRVHFVTGVVGDDGARNFDPASDIEALVDHIALMDPAPSLLMVDPIVSAVAGDSHKNAEVRRSLQPLVDLAATRRCAVLGITHFTKGSGGRDPVERMTGSLAFGALVRVGMVAAKMPDNEGGGRVLARAKNNLGPDTGGFGYDLDVCEPIDGIQTTRVLWGDALEGTAREILSKAETLEDPEEQTMLADAVEFLKMLLTEGPTPSKKVYAEAKQAGHSERTIRRAKERLGVECRKDGAGPWKWSLKPMEVGQDVHVFPSRKHGQVGHLPKNANLAKHGQLQNEKAGDDYSDVYGEGF